MYTKKLPFQISRTYIVLLLTVAFLSQALFSGTLEAKFMLSDIDDSPYRESIEYLAEKGVVKGMSDGSFRPDILMTRAEFITVLVRAFVQKQDIGNLSECFSDVHAEWFAPYICSAKERKFVNGYPDGSFHPAGNVSYVEAVAMAVAAANIEIVKNPAQKQWYESFLEFAHLNTIFSKYAMLPGTALSRAKAASIIHHILLIHDGVQKISSVRENYSSGCGKMPPGISPSSLTVDGVARTMITAVPSTYNKNTPVKLVFAIHGRTNSNEMVRGYYKVEQAAQGKAIFVYPSGLKSGTGYSWGQKDIAFFDSLLAKFSQQYCIDLDEVYVVGHSLGGWMTGELACARGDVIRGIATVGGAATKHTHCSGPVAAMIWHNPKDNLVAFSQGIVARDNIKLQNQLGWKTIAVEPRWAHCVRHTGGQPDAPLVWCPHTQDYETYGGKQYYPHVWPNGAGQEIWKFFEELES